MNTNDFDKSGDRGDDHLLWQLRGLRQERMPEGDLWPGIAARISRQAAPATGGNVVPLRRRNLTRLAPWALAASLVLAVGVAWQQRPDPVAPQSSAPMAGAVPRGVLMHREADAMSREYAAALRELQTAGRPTAAAGSTLRQLDRSAAQIRTALQRDPDARFLLERLRSTYEKRLELTQRAILS